MARVRIPWPVNQRNSTIENRAANETKGKWREKIFPPFFFDRSFKFFLSSRATLNLESRIGISWSSRDFVSKFENVITEEKFIKFKSVHGKF